MPFMRAGLNLYYEVTGEGDPLVLVHGSWNDHTSWQPAIEADFRASFRVVSYDRRGHGQSEAGAGRGTRRQDEDDLAALIEQLGPAPAHVAGNSFGGIIALGLAARRPELLRSIMVHEPPLVSLVADDPAAMRELAPTQATIATVLDHLREGEHEAGARLFVEQVAMGPGTWDGLPAQVREKFVDNALTWLDEQSDPDWSALDLTALSRCTAPVLLSHGTDSPAWFTRILDRLAEALPQAHRQTIEGAGHIPHVTHPDEYVATLTHFLQQA
ncbi:alpha/beta fold hydrolase [Streptomyces sp. NPDC060028]|uniref:alpha/beta fold hydrolase n=1 Tax=Streptomyces sp. NPDC060028 TaxID=3347041 RepID=UPI0036CECA5A